MEKKQKFDASKFNPDTFDLNERFQKEWYPGSYQIQASDAPVPPPIWDGIIPSTAQGDCNKVILFGPTSVGKSTFCFDLAEHVQMGQDFLGRATTQSQTLYISLDMPKNVVFNRWLNAGFQKHFDFWTCNPFNCISPFFQESETYCYLKALVRQKQVKFVIVDALREVLQGNLNDDDVALRVYDSFKEWMPGATILFIHHTRKSRYDQNGRAVGEGSDDNSHGSKYFTNLAQVGLSLHKANREITDINVTKSQVYQMPDEPISIFLDDKYVKVHLWDDAMQKSDKAKLLASEQKLSKSVKDWFKLSKSEQNKELAKDLGVTLRTVQRYRAAAQKI